MPEHDTVAERAERPAVEPNAFDGSRPAWKGAEIADVDLILEGGAMRAQFSAGVLDVFMDRGLFCGRTIGVSAGALCGYNYVAGAKGRSCYLNVKYCDDWRYLSLKSFVRTGNAYGREFAFERIPNELEPFDARAFDESPLELVAVSSNLATGEADYHELASTREGTPYLIASSSMPLVSQIVEIDGKLLLDGGACDSVPYLFSLLTAPRERKRIVVLTQADGYVKTPTGSCPCSISATRSSRTTWSACSRATSTTTAPTARSRARATRGSCSSSARPSPSRSRAWRRIPAS